MKRKLLSAFVIAAGLFLTTACQEDSTMDELIQDIEMEEGDDGKTNTGGGTGSGSGAGGGSGSGGTGGGVGG